MRVESILEKSAANTTPPTDIQIKKRITRPDGSFMVGPTNIYQGPSWTWKTIFRRRLACVALLALSLDRLPFETFGPRWWADECLGRLSSSKSLESRLVLETWLDSL